MNRTCAQCGGPINAARRVDAVYCGGACRVAAHRAATPKLNASKAVTSNVTPDFRQGLCRIVQASAYSKRTKDHLLEAVKKIKDVTLNSYMSQGDVDKGGSVTQLRFYIWEHYAPPDDDVCNG
jgi:hypothetical protein